jgi:hypothetical protein
MKKLSPEARDWVETLILYTVMILLFVFCAHFSK